MRKIGNTPYDNFVKKLEGGMGKTYRRDDLFRIWLSAGGSKARFAYGLGKAKHQSLLSELSSQIFLVGPESEEGFSFDERYWDILDLLIREYAPSGALIAHEKSMELHLRNFEIPRCLVLYTRDTAKRIRMGEFEFHFRILKSGEKTHAKNMFPIFMRNARAIQIDNHTFHTLSLEGSLLDVASIKRKETGISEDIILRYIRKYEKSYSRKILGELVSYRYIRAMNRIRSIAKVHGFHHLYEITLDVIKKEGGGCYLSL